MELGYYLVDIQSSERKTDNSLSRSDRPICKHLVGQLSSDTVRTSNKTMATMLLPHALFWSQAGLLITPTRFASQMILMFNWPCRELSLISRPRHAIRGREHQDRAQLSHVGASYHVTWETRTTRRRYQVTREGIKSRVTDPNVTRVPTLLKPSPLGYIINPVRAIVPIVYHLQSITLDRVDSLPW